MSGVSVRIVWAANKSTRPTSGEYSTLAFFPHDERWPSENWSVVLNFEPGEADKAIARAAARFLSEDSPSELMQRGSTFAMLEGHTITAIAVVD